MRSHDGSAFVEPLEYRRLLSIGYAWGLGGGCSEKAQADAVVMDGNGAVYIAGRFSGTMDVDPSEKQLVLTAAGPSDLFVIKYSADRQLIWARQMTDASGQVFPTALSLDPNGLVDVVGSFSGSMIVAPGVFRLTSVGGEDAFIIQMNRETGDPELYISFGGPYYDAIRSVDASHGVPLVGGVFTRTARFPQAGIVKSAGGMDGFLLRYAYDADVNPVWTIGGRGKDAINQIALDSGGRISVVGTMEGTARFGTSTMLKGSEGQAVPVYLTSHGGKDAFFARYDGKGNVFAQCLGGSGDEYGVALAVGPSATYIAGTFCTSMYGLTPVGGTDVFVKKLNGAIRQIGSPAKDTMGKLAVDATGRLIASGTFSAPMRFNDIPLANTGRSDVFMAMYDRALAPETIAGIGGPDRDTATGLATAPGGAVCLAGSFQRSIDLGPGDITALIQGNAEGEFYLDRLLIE